MGSCIGFVTGFSGYDTIFFLGTGSVRRYDSTRLPSGYFWIDAITYVFGFSATLSFIIDVRLELLVWLLSWLVPGSRKFQGISNQLEQFYDKERIEERDKWNDNRQFGPRHRPLVDRTKRYDC